MILLEDIKNIYIQPKVEKIIFIFIQHYENIGSRNGRSKLTEADVINIRTRKKLGESSADIYKDYEDKLTYGSFCNVYCGCN